MRKIENAFPFVDAKTPMRRFFKHSDTHFQSFMFLDACYDNLRHFQLVLCMEKGDVFGVKQEESLIVFKGYEQFNEHDFASVVHLHFTDFAFEPGYFPCSYFFYEVFFALLILAFNNCVFPKIPFFHIGKKLSRPLLKLLAVDIYFQSLSGIFKMLHCYTMLCFEE